MAVVAVVHIVIRTWADKLVCKFAGYTVVHKMAYIAEYTAILMAVQRSGFVAVAVERTVVRTLVDKLLGKLVEYIANHSSAYIGQHIELAAAAAAGHIEVRT